MRSRFHRVGSVRIDQIDVAFDQTRKGRLRPRRRVFTQQFLGAQLNCAGHFRQRFMMWLHGVASKRPANAKRLDHERTLKPKPYTCLVVALPVPPNASRYERDRDDNKDHSQPASG